MSHKTSRLGIIAWCFYDWANSSFPTLVLTFIFATYFTESVAKTKLIGTAQWGNAIAISGVIIAILSPIFGAIADRQGRRKPWLALFTMLIVLAAAGLWWVKPDHQYTFLTLFLVALGMIGLEVGSVFYNAMLRDISPENYIGRISGWGWGFGYVGGLTCLTIALFAFLTPATAIFHLDHQTAQDIRICGPFVALWTFIFSLPVFIWTPDIPFKKRVVVTNAIAHSLQTLWQTLRWLPQNKPVFLFLIAHMLYIDGLNTLFAFGGIYAAGTFGLTMSQVLIFGISMNVAAGLGAGAFAWLDDYWGSKPTVLLSLFLMLAAGCGVLLAQSVTLFWILALILGLFVGPVQAASRSLLARLAPAHMMTELFGLYAFSGKATAFLNPWLVGVLTIAFNSQRIGMVSVMVFVLLGAALLTRVKIH